MLNIKEFKYFDLLKTVAIKEQYLSNIIKYTKFLKNNIGQKGSKNKYFFNITKPKVSFIASVYNKELYLNSFISSVQSQDLKEFELILVDDFSNDKSIEIIEEFKKYDNRIKLIKNNKNMGTLNTRYKGALFSKGEYIIFVDSDDIVLKKGIMKAYNHMKKKNLDMVEFHSVFEINSSISFINRRYIIYIVFFEKKNK